MQVCILLRNIVICELQRCLVQERSFVVTYKIGLSSHYICRLVVESGCHWLVLVAVAALNNIAGAVPLIIRSSMIIWSAATVLRVVELIS